jgi:hypothetical protein
MSRAKSRRTLKIADELAPLKRRFLNKYNKSLSVNEAARRALAAATQHNSLYAKNASVQQKTRLRSDWKDFLLSLEASYRQPKSGEFLIKDILRLRRRMNAHHGTAFRTTPHPRFNTDPGFRLSHAQKSITVFLKHLWCLGRIAEPPHCPVDGIILGKAGLKYPKTKWGYVNDPATHCGQIEFLRKAADKSAQNLAEWELRHFKP